MPNTVRMTMHKSVSPRYIAAIRRETDKLVVQTVEGMQTAWESLLPTSAIRPSPALICFDNCISSAIHSHEDDSRVMQGNRVGVYNFAVAAVAARPHTNAPELLVAADAAGFLENPAPTWDQVRLLNAGFLTPAAIGLFAGCSPTAPAVALRGSERVWCLVMSVVENRRMCADTYTNIATLMSAYMLHKSMNLRTFASVLGWTTDEINDLARFVNALYRPDGPHIEEPITMQPNTRPTILALATFVDFRGRTYAFASTPPRFDLGAQQLVSFVITQIAHENRHRRTRSAGWYRGEYQHTYTMADAVYAAVAKQRANLPFEAPLQHAPPARDLSGWACMQPDVIGEFDIGRDCVGIQVPQLGRSVQGLVLWPNEYAWTYPVMVVAPLTLRQLTVPTLNARPESIRYVCECYCYAYSR